MGTSTACDGVGQSIKHLDWMLSSTTSSEEREGPTIMPYISYVYEVVNVVVCPGDSDIKVNPLGNYKTI